MIIDHVAPKLFAKDGFGNIVQNSLLQPPHNSVYKLIPYYISCHGFVIFCYGFILVLSIVNNMGGIS